MYFLLYIKIFFRDTRSVNLNVYNNVLFFPSLFIWNYFLVKKSA